MGKQMYREVVEKYSDHRNASKSLHSLNINPVYSAWDWMSLNQWKFSYQKISLYFIMDKVIDNQMAKKAPRRQRHWCLCQTHVTRTLKRPFSAEEGMNGCISPQCWKCAALWYRGVPGTASKCCSENRLTHSLLWCSHLHLNTRVLSHSRLPHCGKGADLSLMAGAPQHSEVGWGQGGADTVAPSLPWGATASSMASCKLDTDVAGNRERATYKRVSTFSVVFLAIKILWHDHGQNPVLQGNI